MPYSTFGTPTYGYPLLSLATGDPFESLSSDPSAPREFIFRGYPKDANGAVVNVDRSSSGYTSQSADTPYKFFESGLRRPYNFTVNLPQPLLAGGTQLGIGDITQNNKDGSLDSAALLDWLGAQSDVYIGSPEPNPLSNFTAIFKGAAAGVTYNLDSVHILHRDMRFKIQTSLHKSRYRGFGAAIRGNGTTSIASATVACPIGNMTFECDVRPATSANALKYLMAYQSSGLAGGRFLRFIVGANNLLQFLVINDAAAQFSISYSGLPVGVLQRVSAVLDATGVLSTPKIYLYIDGEQVATPVAVSGTFNTVFNAFAALRRPDTVSSWLDADMDNITIWPTAQSQAQIKANRNRELLGTEGQTALWKLNEGSGAGPAANSVSGGVGLTLSGTTWVGSLEGDSSIAGTVKPVALGKTRQVQPKLVDSQRLVYQYHDGNFLPSFAVDAVRDSGDGLTFGADVSNIYSVAPAAGTYNTCLAEGLIRLGSSPIGTITMDVRGAAGGIIGYADKASTIHRKLMVDYGGLDNTFGVDDGAYNILALLNPAIVGRYHDTEIKIDAAGDMILQDINAWGGPKRTGVMTVGRIDDPQTLTPTVHWTEEDLDQSSGRPYETVPLGVRYKEIVIGYRPYQTTLSADQVAGIVGLSARADFAEQYRYVTVPIPDASEDADTLTILTSMDSEADALAEANRLVPFRGRDLSATTLSLTSGILTHFIGTVVSLTINQVNADGRTIQRYDTAGGKPYIVIGIAEDMGESGSPDKLQASLVG
jgi:hypothetical protein